MTKAIKFNLTLDKYPVRDLEDLREHFNLDDLLAAYQNKILHRWLNVRNLHTESYQLMDINSEDEIRIAESLCKIFQVDLTNEEIGMAVYPFTLRRAESEQIKVLAERQFNRQTVINSYHQGYEDLCENMLTHSEDYAFIKAAIAELWANYKRLFRVDFNAFFDLFTAQCPLTLFAMLANENYRESNLFNSERKEIVFSCIPT